LPPFRVKIGITFADGAPVQEALNTFFQVVASDTDSQVIVLRCLAHMLKQTMPSLPGSRLQDAMGLFQKLRALQTLARTGLCDMMAEAVQEEASKLPHSEARSYTSPDLANLEEFPATISHHFQRSTSDETGGPNASKLRSAELGIATGGREGFRTEPTGKEGSQVTVIADLYRSNRTPLKFSNKTATGPEALVDSKARRKSFAGKTSSTLGSMPTISELPEMEVTERVPTDETQDDELSDVSSQGDEEDDDGWAEEAADDAADDGMLSSETEGSEFAEVPDDDVALPEAPVRAGVVRATPAKKVLNLRQLREGL